MSPEVKDAIEIAKLVASIATPIAVVYIGYALNSRLKSLDDAQWQNRKIVERRLELYDRIAPGLNSVFCFCMWVGYWKDITPADLLKTKRELDKTVNVYRYILSDSFYEEYNTFIHLIFETWVGAGRDALIKSDISGENGDRRKDANYEWKEEYNRLFSTTGKPTKPEIVKSYGQVMASLQRCVGLSRESKQS